MPARGSSPKLFVRVWILSTLVRPRFVGAPVPTSGHILSLRQILPYDLYLNDSKSILNVPTSGLYLILAWKWVHQFLRPPILVKISLFYHHFCKKKLRIDLIKTLEERILGLPGLRTYAPRFPNWFHIHNLINWDS